MNPASKKETEQKWSKGHERKVKNEELSFQIIQFRVSFGVGVAFPDFRNAGIRMLCHAGHSQG